MHYDIELIKTLAPNQKTIFANVLDEFLPPVKEAKINNGDPKGARIYFVEWFKNYRDLFVKRSKK